MLKGHIYPKLTSKRSPRDKRKGFDRLFKKLLDTDFEGEPARFIVDHHSFHRPSRHVLRDMAWSGARNLEKERRGQLASQVKPRAIEPSRIIKPMPRLKGGRA